MIEKSDVKKKNITILDHTCLMQSYWVKESLDEGRKI
jgi:hypothetical protein